MTDKNKQNKSQWRVQRLVLSLFHTLEQREDPPVFSKQDQVPVLGQLSCHGFILTHALWPGITHWISVALMNKPDLPLWAIVLLYSFAYINMILREGKALKQMGNR